jgi:hypothetical protein
VIYARVTVIGGINYRRGRVKYYFWDGLYALVRGVGGINWIGKVGLDIICRMGSTPLQYD